MPTVNGGYEDWSTWADCAGTCNSVAAVKKRSRTACNNPTPALGGDDCSSLQSYQEVALGG